MTVTRSPSVVTSSGVRTSVAPMNSLSLQALMASRPANSRPQSSTTPPEVKALRKPSSSWALTTSMKSAMTAGICSSDIAAPDSRFRLTALSVSALALEQVDQRGSARGVPAVGEDRLAGDPPALGGEEPHDRGDVLDLGELVAHRLRLVELHALRCLLAVEERSVHRARSNGGDRDASVGEFLGRRTREVLDGALAARIGRVPIGEGREQSRDDGDDLPAVAQVPTGLLDEEVGGLGVDVEHRVVLVLARVHDRLAQHLARSVDGDVDRAERRLRILEELRDVLRSGQVAAEQDALDTLSLDRRESLLGLRARGLGVVVNGHRCPGRRGLPGDEAAEVLAATGDEHGLSCQSPIGHLLSYHIADIHCYSDNTR